MIQFLETASGNTMMGVGSLVRSHLGFFSWIPIQSHPTEVLKAVLYLVRQSGIQEIRVGRLQRFWRDIHAASAHISMNWDAVGALHGRINLGLPSGPAQF